MRESIFNIKVKVDEDEYIYNSRNNGIIQINKNDLKNKKIESIY